jgi:hypothetical protein
MTSTRLKDTSPHIMKMHKFLARRKEMKFPLFWHEATIKYYLRITESGTHFICDFTVE